MKVLGYSLKLKKKSLTKQDLIPKGWSPIAQEGKGRKKEGKDDVIEVLLVVGVEFLSYETCILIPKEDSLKKIMVIDL